MKYIMKRINFLFFFYFSNSKNTEYKGLFLISESKKRKKIKKDEKKLKKDFTKQKDDDIIDEHSARVIKNIEN